MKYDQVLEEKNAISYLMNVRTLPNKGVTVKIEANNDECELLTQKHNVSSVTSLTAELQILPWKKSGVKIKGDIYSNFVQTCIITLEPLPGFIHEKIDVVMVPEGSKLAKPKTCEETGEIFIDAEGPDLPEVFQGDSIDIGALVEEFFELSLNPYPRKAGAIFQGHGNSELFEDDKVNPFDILKKLKDN